jgi:hypothetical protein
VKQREYASECDRERDGWSTLGFSRGSLAGKPKDYFKTHPSLSMPALSLRVGFGPHTKAEAAKLK